MNLPGVGRVFVGASQVIACAMVMKEHVSQCKSLAHSCVFGQRWSFVTQTYIRRLKRVSGISESLDSLFIY